MLQAVLDELPGWCSFIHMPILHIWYTETILYHRNNNNTLRRLVAKAACFSPTIMFNEHSIISATGAQQGDPLGALLFCITLQPVLEQVMSELNIGYLDGITLGGIAADVEMIRVEAGRLGLKLNDAKCELINNGFNECSHQAFSGFIRIDSDDATLLGSPLCSGNGLTAALTQKCDDLQRAMSRLHLVGSHYALCIVSELHQCSYAYAYS